MCQVVYNYSNPSGPCILQRSGTWLRLWDGERKMSTTIEFRMNGGGPDVIDDEGSDGRQSRESGFDHGNASVAV